MAVTRSGNTIRMTAANDEVAGLIKVQAVTLEHTAAANASLGDSAGFVHDRLQVTTSKLTDQHVYPKGIFLQGVKATVLSAGTLLIHIE